MIKQVKIENFKCFKEETISLKDLTILTGVNSSGKSSLIQAILFLFFYNEPNLDIDLHNYIISLGDFTDLKNKYTNPKKISAEILNFENKSLKLEVEVGQTFNINESFKFGLTYLSANRTSLKSINSFNSRNKYGIYGQNIPSFFEKNKNEPILKELLVNEADSETLDGQLNYWIRYISNEKELSFDTNKIGSTDIQAIFKLEKIVDSLKPENLGIGLSHLISILTICLAAKKDELIIIENPEIHLHPLSQAKLGEFFAFVASRGIQIIIETHNDHIINSVCYQEFKNKIKSEDIIIQYKKSALTPFEEIEIKNGQFFNNSKKENRFPEGFFDATLKEIMEINS